MTIVYKDRAITRYSFRALIGALVVMNSPQMAQKLAAEGSQAAELY